MKKDQVKETPEVEAPVVETPAVETPAVEAPVVETPAVETPAVEAPVVETPAVETPAVETLVKEIEIVFLVSPTGKFGLAYNVGETCFINENQANELIDAGYAELVTE
jgi:hypothetical protein